MTGLQKRTDKLSSEKEVTIAFFSYLSGSYVRLDGVGRERPVITIKYHFVAHATMDMSLHFALIPLGVLRDGEYEVKIVQLPSTILDGDEGMIRPSDPDAMKHIVCEPFSFVVR